MSIFAAVIGAVFLLSAVACWAVWRSERVDELVLEKLAACLDEQGTKLYGAVWCSHCQNQKKMFGVASEQLPYVECVDEDAPNERSQACLDAEITSYPTWVFGNGQRYSGEMSLREVAEQSGCPFEETNVTAVEPEVIDLGIIEPVPAETTTAPGGSPMAVPFNEGY